MGSYPWRRFYTRKTSMTSYSCTDARKCCPYDAAMSIHQRIKERRLKLGLTMKDLAKASGASSWQTVQQWEKEDGTAPKRLRLEKVAEALQTTPEYLLSGEADSTNPGWPLGALTTGRYDRLPDM